MDSLFVSVAPSGVTGGTVIGGDDDVVGGLVGMMEVMETESGILVGGGETTAGLVVPSQKNAGLTYKSMPSVVFKKYVTSYVVTAPTCTYRGKT